LRKNRKEPGGELERCLPNHTEIFFAIINYDKQQRSGNFNIISKCSTSSFHFLREGGDAAQIFIRSRVSARAKISARFKFILWNFLVCCVALRAHEIIWSLSSVDLIPITVSWPQIRCSGSFLGAPVECDQKIEKAKEKWQKVFHLILVFILSNLSFPPVLRFFTAHPGNSNYRWDRRRGNAAASAAGFSYLPCERTETKHCENGWGRGQGVTSHPSKREICPRPPPKTHRRICRMLRLAANEGVFTPDVFLNLKLFWA